MRDRRYASRLPSVLLALITVVRALRRFGWVLPLPYDPDVCESRRDPRHKHASWKRQGGKKMNALIERPPGPRCSVAQGPHDDTFGSHGGWGSGSGSGS